jgi:Ca-activated chloride channel family protein
VPIDLIILLDASASMRHRMEVVHEAALGFLKTLREGDRGAVVAFNDGVDFLQQLSGDRSALAAAVRGTIAGGGTALHNALYVSLKQFGRKAPDAGDIRRQAIAVLSDGEDTASLVSFDDVLEVARRSGVSIYPISLASEYSEAREQSGRRYFSESQYSMRKLAQETGAQAFFPERIDDLAGAYASIAQELSSQYSLGYVPSNTRLDGQFRRIVVQVTSRPELRPRARTGYVAASAAAALLHQNEVR